MAKWDLSKLPEGRKPLPDEWFTERAQMQDRIKGLEAKLAEYKHVASAIDTQWAESQDEIADLKAKLAKAEVLQEAQKLFNLYAVQVLMLGATVSRLENLESAWINLKTQAELTGGKDE